MTSWCWDWHTHTRIPFFWVTTCQKVWLLVHMYYNSLLFLKFYCATTEITLCIFNQVWTLLKANKRTNELMRLLLNTHHFMRPYLDRRKLSMALRTFIYQFDLQASYRKFLVFFRVFWICESKVNPFSPSEPKAQLSFSSQNLSVVCLRHCCRWRFRKCLIFSSSSLEPIKLGIKHSCVWRAFKLVQLNCQLLFKGEIRVI